MQVCMSALNMPEDAIFQLLVRACDPNKWGPNCQSSCPYCYNGGLCDGQSGKCVCAPGFIGVHCETVLGRNKWGQDGQLRCSSANPDACRGKLFCLSNPYGCSCAAGYYGIDCDQDCLTGMYGASCRSQCHCEPDVSCAADTGVCSNGRCADGWSGENCQRKIIYINFVFK
ncbi:tyrosine-protein kinase receptor Tie-1-like [Amphiura filiformis]|uniref:tyrosine-protein kinase receptor Tie-1-like n=1 Tax=Amphiura filiformis TaxID=82378 RepID=UPI003B221577